MTVRMLNQQTGLDGSHVAGPVFNEDGAMRASRPGDHFGQTEAHPIASAIEATGVVDCSPRATYKADLIRIACEVAALGKRYQHVHKQLFGFSLRAMVRRDGVLDFASMENELRCIVDESRCALHAIHDTGLNEGAKRTNQFVAISEALGEYTGSVVGAASALNTLCEGLRRETGGEALFADYSNRQYRLDKAAYDLVLQQFKRWGARMTELFKAL